MCETALALEPSLPGYTLRGQILQGLGRTEEARRAFQFVLSLSGDENVRVVVDNQSVEMLRGATLDYKDGLMGAGFAINNPNVSRSCGCGNSFS